MPLGGGSLINAEAEAQLRELKRISSNLLAIVDSERSAAGAEPEANVRGFAEACAKAEIGCHVLELRAIENYFPDHAVKATMGESYRRLGPYERLRDVDPSWAKRENWRIAGAMTRLDLEGTDLGRRWVPSRLDLGANRPATATIDRAGRG